MNKLPAPEMPDWIAAQLPAGIQRYRVAVADQEMHVMEIGQGFPILMQHGNPTWGFLYRKIVAHLPLDRFRCIMPDLVGLGFSTKPRSLKVHTLANHAQWMKELLRQLELPELIFVGQDWGGPIGAHALKAFADRVKGMVILNTSLRPPKPNFKPTAFHRFSRMPLVSDFAFRVMGYPQAALHRAQGDPASIQGEVARAYQYPLKGWSRRAAPLAMARMVPNSMDHPSVPLLKETEAFVEGFKGPAAIIWGKRDPVLGRIANSVARILPQAELTLTEGGHFLQEEVAKEIATAIMKVHQEASAS